MASDEKTARAIVLVSRWCSCSALGMGRPTSRRFRAEYTVRQHATGAPRRAAPRVVWARVTIPAVHVVVVGCGRVGTELAVRPGEGRSHAWPSSTRTRTPSAGCPRASAAARWSGSGSTATTSSEAGIERADALAAVTNGDNSNILTARIARETLRHRAGRGPDLRPPPGADLPAARHPHGGHGRLGHRPGAAPAAARRGQGRLDRSQRQGLRGRAGPAGGVGRQEAGRASTSPAASG